MASDRTLRCPDCGMTFNTVHMMTKHRDRFCVGRTTRLTMTSDDYSSDEEIKTSPPRVSHPRSTTDQVDELKKMKAWHRRQRSLMDTNEKILLQEAKQKQEEQRKRSAQVRKVLQGRHRAKEPSPSRDLWELNAEYDDLQDKEEKLRTYIDGVENIMRSPYRQTVHSRASDSSSVSLPLMMSDDEDDETSPQWQREHQAHLRTLADNHGRQLRDLQGKNMDLERQKEEIRRRLEELGRQDLKSSDSTLEKMIDALKEQEKRNHKTLEDLKRQLLAIHQKPPSQKKIISIPYHSGSLVSEVSAMRLAYLQSGGNDPVVLAQMHDMQAEAQMLEDLSKSKLKKKKKPKENDNGFNAQVMMLELENQRLQEEVLYHQNKRKRQQELDYEESMRRMRELQEDLARLRKELKNKPAEQPQIDFAPMFPMPYAGSGFLVFFDFITGLEPGAKILRLITAQWERENELGDPTTFPVTYCNGPVQGYGGFASATVATRQQVPNAKPEPTTGVIVEIQMSNQPHDSRSLVSRCWAKLPLFDGQIHVLTGRWKAPLRATPVRPDISFEALSSIPQLGGAEIFYRVVDWKDAPREGALPVSVSHAQHYTFPPMPYESGYGGVPYQGGMAGYMGGGGPYYGGGEGGGGQPYAGGGQGGPYAGGGPYMGGGVPPPPSPPPREELRLPLDVTPRPKYTPVQTYHSPKKTRRSSPGGQYTRPIVALPPKPVPMDVGNVLGLQVDRVRHAPGGEGKVRLTVYHQYTGQPAKADETAITCTTTPVHSNFKYGYHVFGQQEAQFNDINFQTDMILVARFYLRQRMKTDNMPDDLAAEVPLLDEEKLIAWAVMPLVQVYGGINRVHTGSHKLRMYYPPVPAIRDIPLMPHQYPKEWVKFGKCSVRFHIFTGKPPGTLTPSTIASDLEDDVPEDAWIPCERDIPPAEPFNSGDGFDLYIDGARHLPDGVTISRVAGRIFDKKFDKIGKDITTTVSLDSDIFNPVYNFRQEFRDLAIPASATLLIKVYTIDRYTKRLTVVGFASLNIFVVSGTEKQPPADTGAVQISLNEGAHQLRLYHLGPNANKPLTNQTLRQTQRFVPCASVLVRIVRAAIGPHGKPLEADRVPESDWSRFGLMVPRPLYADGVYLSMECEPTRGENKMFHTQIRRKMVRQRDVISMIGDGREKKLRTDKNISQWIGAQLTRLLDIPPLDLDMNIICRYQPYHGLRVSIDGAMNLPWAKFTMASMCLNPPGSFYYGSENMAYDRLVFVEQLDFGSNFKAPVWHDSWHWYPNRHFHKYLTLIIHLQEIGVTVHSDRYKYGLMDQAWTAIQIFDKHYAITDTFQLPLYEGNPTPDILNALTRLPVKEALSESGVKPAENSSVFVRISDARRHDEIPQPLTNANTEYIPPHRLADYTHEVPSKPLKTLIPQGRAEREFAASLAAKFKSLVYKLVAEEDELNAT